MNRLEEFVAKFGGSVIAIAGKHCDPNGYVGSKLADLLPVECDGLDTAESSVGGVHEIHPSLTLAGRKDSMLKFSENESESLAIWKNLPALEWDARVSRAKPGAQVLLEDPDPNKESRFGKMPILAFQQYGLGQVLYLGTDNTWRWRKNAGERYYTVLWGRMVQRMALAHLLGGSKRTQLTVDKQNYIAGERVTVYGRLYSETYTPLIDPVVSGTYIVSGTVNRGTEMAETVKMRALPEQPGMYRGEFVLSKPGEYRYSVEEDPKTAVEFHVGEPRFEFGDTAMDEAGLKQMAETTGGAFYREEDLDKLAKNLRDKSESVKSETETELWATPFYFALLVSVATAEWILRKRGGLK